MKEIREIIEEYDRLVAANQPLALATVFEVKGSSYRRSGARMLIKDDGNWFGGISGGCIEGNALKKARLVMADGQARLVTYDTSRDDEASIGVSLGCNGVISVIISPLLTRSPYNPIDKLRKAVDSRVPVVLITVLASQNEKAPAGIVLEPDDLVDLDVAKSTLVELKTAIQDVLEYRKSKVIEVESFQFFVELLWPNMHLVVMGGNYDIHPLLQIAHDLGWKKTIVTNPQRLYPPAEALADQVKMSLNDVSIDPQTVGVIMSHDYQVDLNNLQMALASKLSYIGVLGPAVRKKDMIDELREKGVEVDESRIHGPAGLDIGAMQPDEIALSITAEILSVIRQRTAQSLRDRETPIHDREIDSRAEIV